ncbi:amphiphysin isoform X4 [Silurus meridionalis]|uniref:amphiphysin isoform X4 n=1 Tax=Silurus meridionalis TaxID=175797 RepID=UPI001EECD242|nr:amphiphysin isoform X4 [Silurus meridionalis]
MAEIKTGVFAKNVQKKLSRAQEKVLQKLGKADETKDEQFEQCVQNFKRQESEGARLQREMKAYIAAVKGMQQASMNLTESLHEVYEPDWHGKDDVMSIAKNCDALWEDFHEKLVDSTILALDTYLTQFPDIKIRVAKRSRKLIDYDSARHHFETLQTSAIKNERKVAKAEEDLKKAQKVFDDLNVDLQDELPTLWDSRVGFYVKTFKSVSSLEAKFHREISVFCHKLYEVMNKLAEQHSDKMFTIQGAPSDSGPLRLARTPTPPEDESPEDSPVASPNHTLRPTSPGPPRPKSPSQSEDLKMGPPKPPPPKVTPTKEMPQEQIINLFDGGFPEISITSPQTNEKPMESLLDMDFDPFKPDSNTTAEQTQPAASQALSWDLWTTNTEAEPASDAGFTANWTADFGSVAQDLGAVQPATDGQGWPSAEGWPTDTVPQGEATGEVRSWDTKYDQEPNPECGKCALKIGKIDPLVEQQPVQEGTEEACKSEQSDSDTHQSGWTEDEEEWASKKKNLALEDNGAKKSLPGIIFTNEFGQEIAEATEGSWQGFYSEEEGKWYSTGQGDIDGSGSEYETAEEWGNTSGQNSGWISADDELESAESERPMSASSFSGDTFIANWDQLAMTVTAKPIQTKELENENSTNYVFSTADPTHSIEQNDTVDNSLSNVSKSKLCSDPFCKSEDAAFGSGSDTSEEDQFSTGSDSFSNSDKGLFLASKSEYCQKVASDPIAMQREDIYVCHCSSTEGQVSGYTSDPFQAGDVLTSEIKSDPSASKTTQKNLASDTDKDPFTSCSNCVPFVSDIDQDAFISVIDRDLFAIETIPDPFASETDQDPFTNEINQDPLFSETMQDPIAKETDQDPFISVNDQDQFAIETIQDPFASETDQDPFINEINQDPFINKTIQDAFAKEIGQDPFISVIYQDPFAIETVQDPIAKETDQDPFTNEINQDPLFSETMQEPIAKETDQDPFISVIDRDLFAIETIPDPFASETDQDPFTNEINQDPLFSETMQDPIAKETDQDPFISVNDRDLFAIETIQDPFASETDQDPFINEINQDPFSNKTIQDAFAKEIGQDPFTSEINQDPFASETVHDLFAVKTDWDSFAIENIRDPFTIETDKNSFTSKITCDHFASENNQDPFLSHASQDRFASENNKDPFMSQTNCFSFASEINQNSFASETVQDLFANETNWIFFASEKIQDPFTSKTIQDPFTSEINQDSFTGKINLFPFPNKSDQDPFASETNQDSYTNENNWEPFAIENHEYHVHFASKINQNLCTNENNQDVFVSETPLGTFATVTNQDTLTSETKQSYFACETKQDLYAHGTNEAPFIRDTSQGPLASEGKQGWSGVWESARGEEIDLSANNGFAQWAAFPSPTNELESSSKDNSCFFPPDGQGDVIKGWPGDCGPIQDPLAACPVQSNISSPKPAEMERTASVKEPENSDLSEDEVANQRYGKLYQELDAQKNEVTNLNRLAQVEGSVPFVADFDNMSEALEGAETITKASPEAVGEVEGEVSPAQAPEAEGIVTTPPAETTTEMAETTAATSPPAETASSIVESPEAVETMAAEQTEAPEEDKESPIEETPTIETKPEDETGTVETKPADEPAALEVKPAEETDTLEVKPEEETDTLEVKPEEEIGTLEVKPEEEIGTLEVKPEEKIGTLEVQPEEETDTLIVKPEGETGTVEVKPGEETSKEGASKNFEEEEKMPIPSVVIEPASSNEGDDDRDGDIVSPVASSGDGVTPDSQTAKDISFSGMPPGFLYKVETMHDFEAANPDELDLKRGDIVLVVPTELVEDQDAGWLTGIRECDWLHQGASAHKGLFPENFIQRLG